MTTNKPALPSSAQPPTGTPTRKKRVSAARRGKESFFGENTAGAAQELSFGGHTKIGNVPYSLGTSQNSSGNRQFLI
ncbi:MAG: hypothetical protein KIT22_09460, partial [Verrucomicrobiae bacterium]|nr:hypothetical protein [Verrucomicrobiae bacterium]